MPVLYVDYQGNAAPLSNTYHATASRDLTSHQALLEKTEIDSTYCPQCLSSHDIFTSLSKDTAAAASGYHDAASISSNNMVYAGRCISPQCKLCPVCFVPLTISCRPSVSVGATTQTDPTNSTNHFAVAYQCGYCRYDSGTECGIEVNLATVTNSMPAPSQGELKLCAQQLHHQYRERTSLRGLGSNNDTTATETNNTTPQGRTHTQNTVSSFDALIQGWNHKVNIYEILCLRKL
jgi:hypothetical protein